MHTKSIVLHTTDFVNVLICYKLIITVFFIQINIVFMENTQLILSTELLLIQVIVYPKTNMTLHTYQLPEKPHRIGKNVSVFGTGYFSH